MRMILSHRSTIIPVERKCSGDAVIFLFISLILWYFGVFRQHEVNKYFKKDGLPQGLGRGGFFLRVAGTSGVQGRRGPEVALVWLTAQTEASPSLSDLSAKHSTISTIQACIFVYQSLLQSQ